MTRKREFRWGKRLAVLGSSAAAVAAVAVPGSAMAGTSATHPSVMQSHCETRNLRIEFGKPTATKVAYQHQVRITLVNMGRAACSTTGYPGVDLVGDGGQMKLHVVRAHQRYSRVMLGRGQHSSFTLTYQLETPREIQGELGAWGPNTIVITAPNSVSHQTLRWRLGPVYWRSIETGRGTYVSAVGR